MKVVRVIWTREALNDLETIYDFLAQHSHAVAQRIIESLLSRTRQLEFLPESGVKHEILTRKEYRYLVEGNYKIIYTYQKHQQVVYVAIVFDTRLNPDKLKF